MDPTGPDKNSLGQKSIGQRNFGPEKRLKKRSDFLLVQSTGRKWKTKNLLFSVTPGKNGFRLGITITTKVDKRAVRRNKFKRRTREIFRKLYSFLEMSEAHSSEMQFGADIVVIAQNGAADLEYREIKSQINFALKRLGILPSNNRRA